jgi:hypothetical protein
MEKGEDIERTWKSYCFLSNSSFNASLCDINDKI